MKKELIRKIVTGAFVFVVIGSLVGSLVYFFPRWGGGVPEQVNKAMEYINEMVREEGQTASLISWKEEGGLYKIDFKIGEQQYQSFLTKDGKYLFPYGINLAEFKPVKVEKRERPDVKLFVMSYCPFGLQMEKALLPVWKLLKDKADFGIYFVDYIMHDKKEIDENLRQYCIQKENVEKYLAYLECFVKKGSEENLEVYKNCLEESGIDENKLNSCIEETDKKYRVTELYNDQSTWRGGRYPPFNVHEDLNEKYRVGGSPTLVINDTVVRVARSPEKVKEAICDAFLNPPEECNQKLPENFTSPGFGMTIGSSSSGSCQ
jgi:hypothetical protein